MADISWYGEAVFADTASRDRAETLIDDYMEATQGTLPYGGVVGYPQGCERVTQLHIDEFDGPGLRWCHRMPQELSTEAAAVITQVDALALTYNFFTSSIT